MLTWNLIVAALAAITIPGTPLAWFRWRRRSRLHRRLVAVVTLPGDSRETILEFWGEAAAGVRGMMPLVDLTFLLSLEDRQNRAQSPAAADIRRARAIIDQAATAWLTTDDGQRWLASYLR
jgi:hypothetical protein